MNRLVLKLLWQMVAGELAV